MTDTTPAPAPLPATVEDDHHGDIRVELVGEQRETLVVSGEGIPRVVLTRAPGAEVDDHILIGTRAPRLLTLTVDGRDATIKPGKGKLRRRSYRVDVRCAGTAYRLVPDSIPSSRLTRDGKHIGDFSSAGGDRRVIAEWRDGAVVEPADAAIGYALAAAFGTGGQPMWMMAIETVSEFLP
ncbi:hypothetical protein CG717_03490 [Streptomyces sp. CB02613]|uniref:hypothetical protein n=1 Tax=Streptomyces sp. CB02613 TaxID=2020328 RepID=UPI00081B6F82|nr:MULTISPECIES: hypothetical protein [unclassified Streptomyces]PJN35303.1 hypothetical protein CG717_03490 [Streptomyces sp. CB02613]SCD52841.1 hypothetical protein GA0115253_1008311 [Streptomyces sp. Termitarium-T10T-6]